MPPHAISKQHKMVSFHLPTLHLLPFSQRFFQNTFLPEPLAGTGETMENAINIGRYYPEHAKAAFSLMDADNILTLANMS